MFPMIVTPELFAVLTSRNLIDPLTTLTSAEDTSVAGFTVFGPVHVGNPGEGLAASADPVEFGYLCGALTDCVDVDTRVGVRRAGFLGQDIVCQEPTI